MPKIRSIKQFDREECRRLGGAIEEALQKVGQQYGVHIKRGNGSFNPTSLTLKIEAAIIGENGAIKDKGSEDFKRYATMYGLQPSDLGRKFKDWSGKEFEITGLAMRRTKNPILAKNTRTGKGFVWPEKEVQVLLDKSKAKA